MQQDQKVGLALGVLLIGVVAAFFFRNEPEPGRTIRGLERAAEVDREIAEKRLTPYFSAAENDAVTSESTDLSDDIPPAGERKLPRWEEFTADAETDVFGPDPGQVQVPAPAPDPIRYADPPVEKSVPSGDTPRTISSDQASTVQSQPPPTESGTQQFHEVQRGDTLSSIAGKYLGSQVRYRAIYEANRDVLASPDDLQVGMKLRIPNPDRRP